MWQILEHRKAQKGVLRAPHQVRVNYHEWKRIVEIEGPTGLRLIKGFHDEALKGEWFGYRSSRLSRQWRVIYRVEKKELVVYVVEINPHDY